MDTVIVPFSYYYMLGDAAVASVHGVLRTEPDGLAIEFRQRVVNYAGEEDSAPDQTLAAPSIDTLLIPWDQLQSATRKPWLRRPRIVLRTRSLRALEGLPEARGCDVTFPVARADHRSARELAATVEAAVADHRLRSLEAPPLPTLPPPDPAAP